MILYLDQENCGKRELVNQAVRPIDIYISLGSAESRTP